MSKKPKDFKRIHLILFAAQGLGALPRLAGFEGDLAAALWLIALGLVVYACWLIVRPNDDDDFTGHRRKFAQRLCSQN